MRTPLEREIRKGSRLISLCGKLQGDLDVVLTELSKETLDIQKLSKFVQQALVESEKKYEQIIEETYREGIPE
jgi:hypothetical protein